jgi:hypothetical protein
VSTQWVSRRRFRMYRRGRTCGNSEEAYCICSVSWVVLLEGNGVLASSKASRLLHVVDPFTEAKAFLYTPRPHPPDANPDTHSNITLLRLWMGFRKQLVKTLIATHAQQSYTGEPSLLIFPRFRAELIIATPHGEPPNPTSAWLLAGTKMAAKIPRIAMLRSTSRAASMWTRARTRTASTGYIPALAARTSHLQCQDKPAQTHCATFSAAILHLVSLRTSMVTSHLS